jgi:hypothetical protein
MQKVIFFIAGIAAFTSLTPTPAASGWATSIIAGALKALPEAAESLVKKAPTLAEPPNSMLALPLEKAAPKSMLALPLEKAAPKSMLALPLEKAAPKSMLALPLEKAAPKVETPVIGTDAAAGAKAESEASTAAGTSHSGTSDTSEDAKAEGGSSTGDGTSSSDSSPGTEDAASTAGEKSHSHAGHVVLHAVGEVAHAAEHGAKELQEQQKNGAGGEGGPPD